MVWNQQTEKMNKAFRDMRVSWQISMLSWKAAYPGFECQSPLLMRNMRYRNLIERNQRFRESKYGAYKHMPLFHTGIEFMSAMLNVIVITVGGYMIFKDVIDIADFLALSCI